MQNEEDEPTVFIVTPHASLMCPLHFGVLKEPVDTPCGCTFCRSCISQLLASKHECPLHGRPLYLEQLRPNDRATGLLNELLIHCKGGIQRSTSGEWLPAPYGCKLWIAVGKRREHEDSCSFVTQSSPIGMEASDKPYPPPMKTCTYREYGCVFYGHTEQELLLHHDTCGYGRLLHRVEELQNQLSLRDAEIARLNNLLAEKENAGKVNMPNLSEILDSMSRGLEKLDEDSSRVFEDAKTALQRTKTSMVNNSMRVIDSIKEAVETARNEFVAKIEELESAVKYKVRSIANSPQKRLPHTTSTYSTSPLYSPPSLSDNSLPLSTENAAPTLANIIEDVADVPAPEETSDITPLSTPTTTPLSTPSTSPFFIPFFTPITTNNNCAVAQEKSEDAGESLSDEEFVNICSSSEQIPVESAVFVTPNPPECAEQSDSNPSLPAQQNEEDEEMKALLEASKQEYIREQALRMAEEESVKQALRLSLMDTQKN